jgi:hypothetical protein
MKLHVISWKPLIVLGFLEKWELLEVHGNVGHSHFFCEILNGFWVGSQNEKSMSTTNSDTHIKTWLLVLSRGELAQWDLGRVLGKPRIENLIRYEKNQ